MSVDDHSTETPRPPLGSAEREEQLLRNVIKNQGIQLQILCSVYNFVDKTKMSPSEENIAEELGIPIADISQNTPVLNELDFVYRFYSEPANKFVVNLRPKGKLLIEKWFGTRLPIPEDIPEDAKKEIEEFNQTDDPSKKQKFIKWLADNANWIGPKLLEHGSDIGEFFGQFGGGM